MRPCSSKKRILEMVTSGKSGRSAARTSPMLMDGRGPSCRRAAALATGPSPPGAGPAAPRAGVEHHPVLADLDLVAVPQDDLVDAVALHVRAVQRAHVTKDEHAAGPAHELRVAPRHRDV